jgi:hypothetical protein
MLAFIAQKSHFKFNNTKEFFYQLYIAIFNGEYYDTNTGRFRPLSHFIELLDYSSKKKLFYLLGENPNLNTSSVIFCTLIIPFLLFKIFIKKINNIFFLLLIVLLIFSSTPILSTLYWSFRPAKRLLPLLSLLLFYFFIKNQEKQEKSNLVYALLCNLGLLLSDEEGYFLFLFFTILFYFSIDNKNFQHKKEWIFINICFFLIVLIKVTTNKTPTFGGSTLNSPIASNILNIINLEKIIYTAKEIFFNFSSGIFGLSGNLSLILYFLYLIILLIPFITKLKSKNNLKIYSFLLFLTFIFYIFFNALLELMGGNIIMRSIGFYYGSSKFIFIVFIILYLTELIKIESINKINIPILKFFTFILIYFAILNNIKYFKYANELVYNFHYDLINQGNFYKNLKKIRNKSCNKEKYITENLKEKFSRKEKSIIYLNKLHIDNLVNVEIIKSYGQMTEVDSIIKFYNVLSNFSK